MRLIGSHRLHPVAALAAATGFLLAAAAPALAEEATRTLKLTIAAGEGRFQVENLAGTMKVVPGAGKEVVAIATIHAENRELADAMRFERVTDRKSGLPTLRVRYPLDAHGAIRYPGNEEEEGWLVKMFGFVGGSRTEYDGERVRVGGAGGVLLYADVEVQLPADPSIQAVFKNHVGTLRGRGVRGDLRFDTGSGDIRLEDVGGSITGDTGSGTVEAEEVEGSFICDTGSGDCRLTGFKGEAIHCDVGSGDVTLKRLAARRVMVDTGSGDVHLVEADVEDFQADTGSGNVYLDARGSRLARISADTGSGDVVLKLGANPSFEAFADQGSGEIIMRYDDARPILQHKELVGYRRGDGRIRIAVDTGSGDLTIEPGT